MISDSIITYRIISTDLSAMATRSTNLLKSGDGTLIYKRRHSLPVSAELEDVPVSSGTQSATAVRSSQRVIRSHYGVHANNEDVDNKTPDRKRPAEAQAPGSVPKRQRTIKTTASGQCVEWDAYCWLCHTEGSASDCCCELCPRLYHKKCLGMKTVVNCWVCPECEKVMKAENIDTRTKPLIAVDTLCLLLRNVILRMKYSQSEPFFRPVDCALLPRYTDYVYHPMDFSTLEKNVKKKAYGSTEAFVADVKWIVHNCIIYNGKKHRLTTVAKTVLKICRHETNEIEICPDCYKNSCTKPNMDWFCEPCLFPHKLVWAKMKGYPFWPAKVLQEQNGQVDVRFFGEHDRAWVPVSQVYLISEQYPVTATKLRKGFDVAKAEMHRHVEMLRERFGSFTFAALRTPYVLQDDKQGVSPGSSGVARSLPSSKLSKHRKNLLHMKRISDENGSRPAVKLVVKLSSSANKQPSVVSKTANAVKLRYSSIISTRRSSSAASSRSDTSVTKSAIAVITGCSKVTDCVVNVERVGSSNAAGGNGSTATNCTYKVSGTCLPEESAANTGIRKEQSEQNEADEPGHTESPEVDDVLLTNAVSNPDTTETEGDSENVSVNDAAAEAASPCQNHLITDSDAGEQSGAKCHAANDEVTVDRSDDSAAVVARDDNECNVVMCHQSNSPAPCTDFVISTDCVMTASSDELNTDSAKTSDEVLMDTSECSVQPSTIEAAKSTNVSEGNLLSDQLQVTSMCYDTCTLPSVPASASGLNAVVQSTVETSVHLSDCCTSEHDTGAGAKEECSESNDTLCEDVLEYLYSSHAQTASDSECVSESSRDLDINGVKLMSVDETDNANAAEKECCHTNVTVTGVLSTGTDLEGDKEHTPEISISTVCHVSQPMIASIATTTPLDSADIATSVPCSSPRFPFLEFLVTQSKQSAVNASASPLSTCVNTSLTVDSINSTAAAACDSTACSLAACLALSVSSTLSYSIARSGSSPLCQLSSLVSHVMSPDILPTSPSSHDSAVTASSSTDVSSCNAITTCCTSSATIASDVNSRMSTATAAAGLYASADICDRNPAELMIDGGSINTAETATTSANIDQHVAAEDCDGNDTTSLQSSMSLNILPTPSDAADSVPPSDCEPMTTGSPFCFSVAGYNFQKYKDMLQSATEKVLEQFCSDILNGAEGSAIRKHVQLEINRLKWEHAQEITEIQHNAAIAVAEQKLTLEQHHVAAIEELQNKLEDSKVAYAELHKKLTREKEFAVAETKKKQWCANCGKEAIFYCCWNTSYCNYPCQHEHWPRHQLTCAQTVDTGRNAETRDHSPQQQSSIRTGQQQVKNNGITAARQYLDGQSQQRQMSSMQMVRNQLRNQLPTPLWSPRDALDFRARAGVRFVPAAPHQRLISIADTTAIGGNSGQGIVLVRHNAGCSTAQLPMLPSSSFFLPPRVFMP